MARAKRATKKASRRPAAKKASKRPAAKKASKRPAAKKAKKRPAATKAKKRPAKKPTKKAAKKPASKATKKPANKATKKRAPTKPSPSPRRAGPEKPSRDAPSRKRTKAKSPAAEELKKKRATRADKTIPGGTAPKADDVSRAQKSLRELREIIERVNDGDAELILGDGNLETLLASVVPAPTRRTQSIHEHLSKHKRRASLLARLRHGINDRSAFVTEEGRHVSPTRVQWFYDGLTFLEGDEPYRGVVGLYREGVVRYGLGVADVGVGESLGPLASDFVSVDEAKKSFRGAKGKMREGLAKLVKLSDDGADDPASWLSLFEAHPWVFGGQHASIAAVERRDADLPRVIGKRAADGAHDVLVIESPSTTVVGSSGKVLSSFRDVWARAERLRTFVQRQASYLQRELRLKIREPRFLIIAGGGLSAAQRATVQREMEAHHAAVRLITFDELRALAERTLAFFEPRL